MPTTVLSKLYRTCFQVRPEFVRLIYLMYVIFVFHAYRYGQQFPLVYCLLPDKSRETYIRVFELIKEKAEEQDLNLNPDTVLSDFELSIIQAMELTFPTTVTKGCFFHFCQCLLRKVQALGLYTVYREDVSFRRFIRKAAGLAFVPECYVRLAWQAIKGEPPTILGTEDLLFLFTSLVTIKLITLISPLRIYIVYAVNT